MPLKAVLFDMDGVIVNTEPLHKKAYYKMFEQFNIAVSKELYASFTGASTKKICTQLSRSFSLNASHEELAKTKRRYFKDFFDTDTDFGLLSGVKELIEHYHANGIKLVVASSASMDTINRVFQKFNLDRFFIGKVSGADLQESKPHPEIFCQAAQLTNEAHENCMVIEDATNGIIAAQRAGIFCAAYKSEHSLLQDYSQANIVVETFKELQPEKLKQYFQ